jgi:hypothetical protein
MLLKNVFTHRLSHIYAYLAERRKSILATMQTTMMSLRSEGRKLSEGLPAREKGFNTTTI